MTAASVNRSAACQSDAVQLACFLESLKAVLEQGQEIHARLARLDTVNASTSVPQHFNLAEDQPKQWAKAPPPPFVESAEPARKPVLKAAPPGLAPATTTVQVKARPTSKAPPSKGKAPPPGFRSDEPGAAETPGQARAAEPTPQGKAPPPHLRTEAASSGTEGSPTHRPELAQAKAPPAHLDPLAKALPPKPQERQPSSPDRGGGTSLPGAPPQAFSKAPPPPLVIEPQEDTSPEASHPVAKAPCPCPESPAAPAAKQPSVKAPPPLFEEKADPAPTKPATKAPPPPFLEDPWENQAQEPSRASRSPPVKQPGAKAPPPHLVDQGPPTAESSAQRAAPKVTFSEEPDVKEELPPARPKQPATKAPPPVFVDDKVPDEQPKDVPADAARSVEEERPAAPASPPVKQPATKAPPPFLVEDSAKPAAKAPPPFLVETPAEQSATKEELAAEMSESTSPDTPAEEKKPEPILTTEDSGATEPCRTLHPPEAKVDGPPVSEPAAPSAKAPPRFIAADEHGSGDAKAPVPTARQPEVNGAEAPSGGSPSSEGGDVLPTAKEVASGPAVKAPPPFLSEGTEA